MDFESLPPWAGKHLERNGVTDVKGWSVVHRRAILVHADGKAIVVWNRFLGKARHTSLALSGSASATTGASSGSRVGSAKRAAAFGVAAGSSAEAAEADVEEALSDYEVHGKAGASARGKRVTVGDDLKPTGMPEVEDRTPEEPAHPRSSTSRYLGDTHPVIYIEGIGPKIAERLKAIGCSDTDQLCRFDAAELAAALDLGQRTIEDWQAMAELAKVKGIGRQFAEVLAWSGVRGIQDLKSRSSRSIAAGAQMWARGQSSRPSGQEVTENRVISWKEAAKACRRVPTTLLHPKAPETGPGTAGATAGAHGSVRPHASGHAASSSKGSANARTAGKGGNGWSDSGRPRSDAKPISFDEALLVVRDQKDRKAVKVAPAREEPPAPAKPTPTPTVEVRHPKASPLVQKVRANQVTVGDEAAEPERAEKRTVQGGTALEGGVEVRKDRRRAA